LRLDCLKALPEFSSEAARAEALRELMEIPDLQVRSTKNVNGIPSFPTSALLNPRAFDGFSSFAKGVVDGLRG
jgi:hypothetical protein